MSEVITVIEYPLTVINYIKIRNYFVMNVDTVLKVNFYVPAYFTQVIFVELPFCINRNSLDSHLQTEKFLFNF